MRITFADYSERGRGNPAQSYRVTSLEIWLTPNVSGSNRG